MFRMAGVLIVGIILTLLGSEVIADGRKDGAVNNDWVVEQKKCVDDCG
jgi:hypothetical protein